MAGFNYAILAAAGASWSARRRGHPVGGWRDLDWRTGELTVRGKGSVHARLPLPREVGAALVTYHQDADIDRLLEAARQLPSPMGLRGLTYATLFGLLAVTGLRISEALALDDADVQRTEARLTIRRSKFGKSRLTPLHASTIERLAVYARTRDRVFPRRVSPAMFLSEQGTRVTIWAAEYTFAKVSGQIGLRPPMHGHRHGHGPRLHDLRHRFAIRTLVRWYRAGLDVDPLLPLLATYLGHVHVHETYWYLEAVPELLALATERLRNGRQEVAP